MDSVIIILAVLALLAMSSWGYGYYRVRATALPGAGPSVSGGSRAHPLRVIGLVLAVVLVLLLLTAWRPVW